jgi:hypothetical protein
LKIPPFSPASEAFLIALTAFMSVVSVRAWVLENFGTHPAYDCCGVGKNSTEERVSHVHSEKEFDQHPEDHEEGQYRQRPCRREGREHAEYDEKHDEEHDEEPDEEPDEKFDTELLTGKKNVKRPSRFH